MPTIKTVKTVMSLVKQAWCTLGKHLNKIMNNHIAPNNTVSTMKVVQSNNVFRQGSTAYSTVHHQDFYSVLSPITWLCRIAGTFPLRLKGPIGERKYSTSYVSIIYSLIVVVLMIASLYAWSANTNERLTKLADFAIVRISIHFELILEMSSMFIMVVVSILSKDKFANAIDSLSKQDILLQKLGTKLDYAADLKHNYIRLGIIVLITSLLCCYDFMYQLDFNLSHPLNWIVWMCPNIVRIATACLFVDVVIVLKKRFGALNEHLRKMIEEMKNASPTTISTHERVCERVRSIALIHGALCEAALSINQTFGCNIIVGVIYALMILTTSMYYIFREIKDTDCSYLQISGCTNWAIISSINVFYIVTVCHVAQNEASLTGKLIHKFQISAVDTPLNNVILSFSLQLHHEKIGFSGGGLFPLDPTLIQSIVGAVTTYLVILIQFDN